MTPCGRGLEEVVEVVYRGIMEVLWRIFFITRVWRVVEFAEKRGRQFHVLHLVTDTYATGGRHSATAT